MKRATRHASHLALALILICAPRTAFAAVSNCAPDGTQASGAVYRICMPDAGRWNGDLVVFAHGYVAFNEPIAIPEDQLVLPDGTSIPGIVNALGFGFAVSSYSTNGLAVLQGIDDLRDLVSIFGRQVGTPGRVFMVGPSEGGLVTALSVEQFPGTYNGGVAACGPIGDFTRQVDYIGNFRVVFDYLFPGVLPGPAIQVPSTVIDNWNSVYLPAIQSAVSAAPDKLTELLTITNAPGARVAANAQETAESVLWYAVFATNDATEKLGGQPFDNSHTVYRGSDNDLLLNLLVERDSADPQALATINASYQTTGLLFRPLVTMHTLGDQIIPYWHEPLYTLKTSLRGTMDEHVNLPIVEYGHCNFNAGEVVFAFATLLSRASGQMPTRETIASALTTPASRATYDALVAAYGDPLN